MDIKKDTKHSRSEMVSQLLELRGDRCPICGRVLDPSSCNMEHIYPVGLGGNHDLDNLQLICEQCSRHKAETRF